LSSFYTSSSGVLRAYPLDNKNPTPLQKKYRVIVPGSSATPEIQIEVQPYEKFDFLGFTFRPRLTKYREGEYGVAFNPAVSAKAVKAMRCTIRVGAFIGNLIRA
jgi:hypothetical protein